MTKKETKSKEKTKAQKKIANLLKEEIAQLQRDKEELAHLIEYGYFTSAQGVLLKAAGNYAHLLMEQVLLEGETEWEEEKAGWEEDSED